MPVNVPLKECETDAAMPPDGTNDGSPTIIAKESVKASVEGSLVTTHSAPAIGGTRLLVGGAWILVVIQVLAITGDLIDGHVRDPSISALLSAPSRHNIAGALGLLLGTTLPGITGLVGGLSLRRRTNHQRGNALSISAAIVIVLMLGLQFTPRCSLANWRFFSTPSSRLGGHWESRNDPFHDHVNYGPCDSLGMGTCYGADGSVLFTYQILSEERSGTRLVARQYLKGIAVYDAEYCVSKDGRSMTKEYVFHSGSRWLCEYRRTE
jgi:hypothetical protein